MTTRPTRFSHLSPAWQALVRKMQRLNFGAFTNLQVVDGTPKFNDDFESVTTYRIPGDNSPRPESTQKDFALPAEVVEFIKILQKLNCRRIAKVVVRHGLPVSMEVEEVE